MTFSMPTANLHTNALARGQTPPYVLRKYYRLYLPSGAPCSCACHTGIDITRSITFERWSDYPEQLSLQTSQDRARQDQARSDRIRDDEVRDYWIRHGGFAPSYAAEVITLYQERMVRHLRTSHSDRKNGRDFDNLTLGLFSEHLQLHVASGSPSYTPLGDTTLEARMIMAAENPGRYPLHDAFFAQLAEDGVALDGWIMMDELKLRTSSYMLEFYDTEVPADGWKEDGWEEALNLGEGTAHLEKIVAIMKQEEGSDFDADGGAR